MPQNIQPFSLRFQDVGSEVAVIPEENLHEVFSIVERKRIREPVEVFQGERRVARMKLAENGVWEIDWHADPA